MGRILNTANFLLKKVDEKKLSFEDLNENILKTIEKNLDNFDCIL